MRKAFTIAAVVLFVVGASAILLQWRQAAPKTAAIEQVRYLYHRGKDPAYSTREHRYIVNSHSRVETEIAESGDTLVKYEELTAGKVVWTYPSKGVKTTMGASKIDTRRMAANGCNGQPSKTLHGYQSYEVSAETQDGRGVHRAIEYRVPDLGCMALERIETYTYSTGEMLMASATLTTKLDHRVPAEAFTVPSNLKELQLGDFAEVREEYRKDFQIWRGQNARHRQALNYAYRQNHRDHDIK